MKIKSMSKDFYRNVQASISCHVTPVSEVCTDT